MQLDYQPIHVAIDALGAKYGGAATELQDILTAAVSDDRIHKISVFSSHPARRLFAFPNSQKITDIPKPWADQNYALRLFWHEWLLGIECLRIKADVLLISANYGRGRFGVPHVTYVQQSLPFSKEAIGSLNSYAKAFRQIVRRRQMGRSCQSAAMVISQSKIMKQWLMTAYGLEPHKVQALYTTPKPLVVDKPSVETTAENREPGHRSRLLYVGCDYPYKRLDTALQGVSIIRRTIHDVELHFTLPHDHHYGAIEGVACVGYLVDDELANAYSAADILILPSLVESGPQPPLEAMSFGVPVLVADRPYARDICEDAAVFFDPNSPADFADKAIMLLTNRDLRYSLVSKGFDLVQRRRASDPYKKMMDIVVGVCQASEISDA